MEQAVAPVVVTKAYRHYGCGVVEVEPYRVDTGTFVVEVTKFVDFDQNKGHWPVGEGYAVKKDGTVGRRKVQVGRTPAVVREAMKALYVAQEA